VLQGLSGREARLYVDGQMAGGCTGGVFESFLRLVHVAIWIGDRRVLFLPID
jgi:hypothetical protein